MKSSTSGRWHRARPRCAVASTALALQAILAGCSGPKTADGDLTGAAEQIALLSRQSTPTEIQASVMAFADKYSSRTADVFDRVHDESRSSAERVRARRAKVAGGLGAITIAAEVNPVVAMVDMVTMVRLKQKGFRDVQHADYSPEHAELIQAMHDQSDDEAWSLASRFLSEPQLEQLRDVIDAWYDANPELRTASYIRLQDFTEFRRESPWRRREAPTSVLRLLQIDPLRGLDPVARELQEGRMLAERAMFFAKRVPPLASWQLQLATADLFATPELRNVLTTTDDLRVVADRLVASSERFGVLLRQMPRDVDGIVSAAVADIRGMIAAERAAAIEQSTAALDAQRVALVRDVQEMQGGVRALIEGVNRTLAEAQDTASAVSGSAQEAVAAAHLSATGVVDHVYRRALVLVIVLLIGVPAAMIVYRAIATRMSGSVASRR